MDKARAFKLALAGVAGLVGVVLIAVWLTSGGRTKPVEVEEPLPEVGQAGNARMAPGGRE